MFSIAVNDAETEFNMNDKLRWLIYIFIVVGTAIGVAFTSSDAGLIDCILVGLGNVIFNFFLVEVVFKKE